MTTGVFHGNYAKRKFYFPQMMNFILLCEDRRRGRNPHFHRNGRIKVREVIVSIFKDIGEVLDYPDIKAHLKILGFKISDDELKDALIELSSPLINWLEKRENRYKLIYSKKFLESQQQKLMELLKWLQ